jgi:hypothetical protein
MAHVVFDSTDLIDLMNPKVSGDKRVTLDNLIQELGQNGARILIPTPCLTELLIHAMTRSCAALSA